MVSKFDVLQEKETVFDVPAQADKHFHSESSVQKDRDSQFLTPNSGVSCAEYPEEWRSPYSQEYQE